MTESPAKDTLRGHHVALSGKLLSMRREEALAFLDMVGAHHDKAPTAETDFLVLGEAVSALCDNGKPTGHLAVAHRLKAKGQEIEILTETEFLAKLGLDELLRLYTSQQLSRILGIERREIDSWVRRGLIRPVKIVNRLYYFDFGQVASAKRLQDLIQSGVPLNTIRHSLEDMESWLPGAGKSLVQLGILEEDGRLFIRLEDGSIADPSGQLQIPLRSPSEVRSTAEGVVDSRPAKDDRAEGRVLPGPSGEEAREDESSVGSADAGAGAPSPSTDSKIRKGVFKFPSLIEPESSGRSPEAENWFEQAAELEETGRLKEASEAYLNALAVDGPSADACFNLGNVFQSMNRLEEAIQRFLQAVEIDPGYIEAWNNLGNALYEVGRPAEAVKALRKSLATDPTYADAHYNLGEVLHSMARDDEARQHWELYLRQDPSSDWAEHVRSRLRDLD